MRSKGIEIKELRADGEKVLNEGEMKKTALANNIHTSTTPPYDKKAGGSTSESLILSGRMSWPYYSRTARAAQIRPIVLKTVAIIYNNMTHGATDKIPSIELFRSRRRSLRSALSAPHLRVHTQAPPQRNAPHGKQDIYLGFKDAHSAYVYDPVTIRIHPRTSPSLRRTRHEFRQHHLGRRQPHRFRTAAPVEGGGGDGLDEVDKFIHDALNQAPPTEGGASPIEGGGEPDLGALGIHGHANRWSTTGCTSASRG
ncbi:hypothetical protein RI054_09g46840 [Pseudoscourfieldia marina]